MDGNLQLEILKHPWRLFRYISIKAYINFVGVVVVFIAFFFILMKNPGDEQVSPESPDSSKKDPLIFASVISARDHHVNRNAIRETWGIWAEDPVTELKFIVGKECHVPPDDREVDQGCQEMHWPHGENYEDTFWLNTFTSAAVPTQRRVVRGFAFIVNFPVVIRSVKLASWAKAEDQRTVTLVNAHTDDEIFSLPFTPENGESEQEENVKPYLLPRGFEGILYVEGDFKTTHTNCHEWVDHGSLIKPMWLIAKEKRSPLAKERTHSSVKDRTEPIDPNTCVPVALSFQFSGISKHLEERKNRQRSWNEKMERVAKTLEEEIETNEDILFVDTVDVYLNLTLKMLDVIQWAATHRKSSFLLKSDDDTFLDLKRMERYIEDVAMEVRNKLWWWASFKENMAVSRYGKWRENVYLSPSYPPYPCGAAYVVSPGVTALLAKRARSRSLVKYPFEDTAMGLWTENLSLIRGNTDICKMDCEAKPKCEYPLCFLLQNRPDNFYWLREKVKHTGSVC